MARFVTKAFRLGVLFGLKVKPIKDVPGVLGSQKPFGLESYSDACSLTVKEYRLYSVTKAFRLGVLFGHATWNDTRRCRAVVTKAFRLGVLFGLFRRIKNDNPVIMSQKPFGLESYSDFFCFAAVRRRGFSGHKSLSAWSPIRTSFLNGRG